METKSDLRELIESLAIAVLIVTFVTVFVGRFCRVEGRSMELTLHDRQWLWTDKLAYWFRAPKPGDIVIIKYQNTRQKYVKRVIAEGGQSIEVKGGKVYIDDYPIIEKYIKEPPASDYQRVVVPEGAYFVMGDNRNFSDDSRNASGLGFVPLSKIEGRALVRIWPVWLFRIFTRPRMDRDYAATYKDNPSGYYQNQSGLSYYGGGNEDAADKLRVNP